jgi:hypothetical protein
MLVEAAFQTLPAAQRPPAMRLYGVVGGRFRSGRQRHWRLFTGADADSLRLKTALAATKRGVSSQHAALDAIWERSQRALALRCTRDWCVIFAPTKSEFADPTNARSAAPRRTDGDS